MKLIKVDNKYTNLHRVVNLANLINTCKKQWYGISITMVNKDSNIPLTDVLPEHYTKYVDTYIIDSLTPSLHIRDLYITVEQGLHLSMNGSLYIIRRIYNGNITLLKVDIDNNTNPLILSNISIEMFNDIGFDISDPITNRITLDMYKLGYAYCKDTNNVLRLSDVSANTQY